MAESRHRHKHVHHHVPPPQAGRREEKKTLGVAGVTVMVFFGLFGLAIAFFAVGSSTAMLIGAVAGIAAGYYVAVQIKKAGDKKNL